jgi:hypothetical protein
MKSGHINTPIALQFPSPRFSIADVPVSTDATPLTVAHDHA